MTTVSNIPGVAYSFVITKNCKHPEIAYRLADFWQSEEASMRGRYGELGVEWDWADEGAIGNNGEPAYFKVIDDVWGKASSNAIWYNDGRSAFLQVHDRLQSANDPYEYNYQLMVSSLNDYKPVAKAEFVPQMPMSEEDMDTYNMLLTDILAYVQENNAKFILGDRPLSEWDAYVAEFDALGVNELLEIINRVYTAFMAE